MKETKESRVFVACVTGGLLLVATALGAVATPGITLAFSFIGSLSAAVLIVQKIDDRNYESP